MIALSVFSLKLGTTMKTPKCSIETMGYHSLLFTESCLIPSVKFFLVYFFLLLSSTVFYCKANSEKLFS